MLLQSVQYHCIVLYCMLYVGNYPSVVWGDRMVDSPVPIIGPGPGPGSFLATNRNQSASPVIVDQGT